MLAAFTGALSPRSAQQMCIDPVLVGTELYLQTVVKQPFVPSKSLEYWSWLELWSQEAHTRVEDEALTEQNTDSLDQWLAKLKFL